MLDRSEIQRAAREFSSTVIQNGFIPQALHEYQDKEGNPLYWRIRLKNPKTGEKWIRPMYLDENKKFKLGEPIFIDHKKPLYRLPEIIKLPDQIIWIVEGEYCADVLSKKGLVVTTSGSAESALNTDWSVLFGKKVIIWPDNDEAGSRYAHDVTLQLRLLNCEVEWIDVKALNIPTKGDCVNWLALHPETTPVEIAALPRIIPEIIEIHKDKENNGNNENHENHEKYEKNEIKKNKFIINDNGVFYETEKNTIWICDKLEVKACVRDKLSENWGKVLVFYDVDKRAHRWSMPMEMLKGSGEELRSELLRLGLAISSNGKARNLLIEYIMTTQPNERACCVRRTGWHDHVFVLPHRTMGKTSEEVFYQSETISVDYKVSGSLQDWQNHVSRLCVGNSRLIFSVSTAFAAMLLYLVGHESGGIHFVGESSTGKTTALRVAASVYGGPDYLNRWRATTNGLEALATVRSDTLLILDELSQVDPKEAGEIAYMLANGSGKSRANQNGHTRTRSSWRLLFISAGEIGLAQHLNTAGKRIKAGQEVRLVDIPADAGANMGIFEDLHGYETGAQFSKTLTENAQQYYGTALIHFLEIITIPEQWQNTVQLLKVLIQKFLQLNLPKNASGQVSRVCERFALIGASGELASLYKITGWKEGESEKSAARCFKDWLERRGTSGNQERNAIIAQFKKFLELHGESRFTEFEEKAEFSTEVSSQRTSNRAGFRRKIAGYYEYYLFLGVYKTEVFADFDPRYAAKILAEEGLIEPENDKVFTHRVYLPGLGQTRCYKISMRSWERINASE